MNVAIISCSVVRPRNADFSSLVIGLAGQLFVLIPGFIDFMIFTKQLLNASARAVPESLVLLMSSSVVVCFDDG